MKITNRNYLLAFAMLVSASAWQCAISNTSLALRRGIKEDANALDKVSPVQWISTEAQIVSVRRLRDDLYECKVLYTVGGENIERTVCISHPVALGSAIIRYQSNVPDVFQFGPY